MCQHHPNCPSAEATDHAVAVTVHIHPKQWMSTAVQQRPAARRHRLGTSERNPRRASASTSRADSHGRRRDVPTVSSNGEQGANVPEKAS